MRRSLRVTAVAGPALLLLTALGSTASAGTTSASTTPPTYTSYAAGPGQADGAGEPSLGNSWTKGTTAFQSNLDTYDVHFTSSQGEKGTSTWTNKSFAGAAQSLDPILYTDNRTGRTIVSQLLLACSQAYLTDDLTPAAPSWTPSQGCGVGTAFDHQTIGGGPYPASPLVAAGAAKAAALGYVDPATKAPHAVYYCAQAAATASCARSDDGGVTFGPGVPIYNTPANSGTTAPVLACAGLHGHLRVAPDGTAYVPNFDCDGHVALTSSEDGGSTWQVHEVQASTTQDESDPSLGIGSKGTLYLGWEEGADNTTGSKAFVGVSHDKGKTWQNVQDAGKAFGIQNVQFPEVIAGDDDRAAYAFLGTPTAGDDQAGGSGSGVAANTVFPGVWHLYVATTYDGGVTWTTVDTTPTDPVQRGCIWLAGGSSSCRNLLDFNDITTDVTGRVLVGWADGCVGACVTTPLAGTAAYDSTANAAAYRANHGVITRQEAGRTLFSAYDGQQLTVAGTTPLPLVRGKAGHR